VGPEGPAPSALEPLQRPDQPWGEHPAFPLSNWTELDIWHYIAQEQVELPSIYCAHTRSVFERNGILLANVDAANRPAADSASVSWLLD